LEACSVYRLLSRSTHSPICESALASEPLISLSQLASCVRERPKPVMEEARERWRSMYFFECLCTAVICVSSAAA